MCGLMGLYVFFCRLRRGGIDCGCYFFVFLFFFVFFCLFFFCEKGKVVRGSLKLKWFDGFWW